MKVAVIGLGTMGMGAALNLVRKGHQVTGCDVREAARTELAAASGAAVARAADLPADTEAVLVFVVNASQTEEVLFGAQGCLSKLTKGGVILCCATVAPEAARALEPKIVAAGFLMLDAPVSGGKAGAHAGTMTVMASGSEPAFAKAQPVLDAISSKVWRLGDKAGVGSHGEDGQSVAGRRAYRDGCRGAGARHTCGGRSAHVVRGHLRVGRQLVDVAEPCAAHPRWR